MRKYSWLYGIFHWFMHYLLSVVLLAYANITVIPIYFDLNLFGSVLSVNVLDYVLIIIITTLIDIDHIPVFKKFGVRKYMLAQKRLVSPLHNFFVLSIFSIATAFLAIYVSMTAAVFTFAIVVHLIWDIVEDVLIFGATFRRWEKTWGINSKDIEDAYDTLVKHKEKLLED